MSTQPIGNRFAQSLESLQSTLKSGETVDQVVQKVDKGEIDVAALASMAPSTATPMQVKLTELQRLVDDYNKETRSSLTLPQLYQRLTSRTPGAVTQTEWTSAKVAAAVAEVAPAVKAMNQAALDLGDIGMTPPQYAPKVDELMKEPWRAYVKAKTEVVRVLGPLDAEWRAGKLDPADGARVSTVVGEVWKIIGLVRSMGLAG